MKIKRGLKLLTVLAAFALILAACGGGGDETTTTAAASGDSTTTAAGEEPTTTAGEEPAGEFGAVTVAAGEAIQVRSMQAISGEVAALGLPNQRAMELAMADYGQIQGHDVSMGTGLDELCTADGGQAAAAQVVADTQVVGVIGTACSGAAAGAMPTFTEAGLVMISSSNTSPSMTSDLQGNAAENYYPGYYRTAHNDLFQGQAAAEFMLGEGITKAATIHDGDPYTEGLTTAFANAFEALGGEIVVATSMVKGETTDMVPVLTEVAGGAPEAIFFPDFPPEGNFIVQQIGQVAGLEDVLLMGADGILVNSFLEIDESLDIYFSGPDQRYGDNANGITGKTADEVLTAYNETFGEAPSAAFWAHAYDATIMLLDAIDQVAVDDGSGNLTIDRQALRDQLNSTSGFEGLIGTLACDEFGDCGPTKITVVQKTDAAQVTVADVLPNVVFEYDGSAS